MCCREQTGASASSVSPNLRPQAGTLSQAQFAAMVRSGVKPEGVPFFDIEALAERRLPGFIGGEAAYLMTREAQLDTLMQMVGA